MQHVEGGAGGGYGNDNRGVTNEVASGGCGVHGGIEAGWGRSNGAPLPPRPVRRLTDTCPQTLCCHAAMHGAHFTTTQGDRVRIYFVNAGPNLISSFHIIGCIFDKVPYTRVRMHARPRAAPTLASPVAGCSAHWPDTWCCSVLRRTCGRDLCARHLHTCLPARVLGCRTPASPNQGWSQDNGVPFLVRSPALSSQTIPCTRQPVAASCAPACGTQRHCANLHVYGTGRLTLPCTCCTCCPCPPLPPTRTHPPAGVPGGGPAVAPRQERPDHAGASRQASGLLGGALGSVEIALHGMRE